MGEGFTVAIVDDDDSVREALACLFRSAGFRAEGFASAEAFLARGTTNAVCCLILDWRMPGVNGFELRRRLVERGDRIPFVMLTAHADEELRARALALGALAFLPKPFDAEALLDIVKQACT